MSLETLLGLRDDPAHLDKYGPIAAALARDLATDLLQHGTFRCAATDPTHATLLGLGHPTHRTGYVPGPRLQDLQRTTWGTCSFPGCRTRATTRNPTTCDLDHAIPWPTGPTCSCNTTPLCRTHHRLKTHGRITLEPLTDPRYPTGTWQWRMPSGRTYRTQPPPLTIEPPRTDHHHNRSGNNSGSSRGSGSGSGGRLRPPQEETGPPRPITLDPDEPPPF